MSREKKKSYLTKELLVRRSTRAVGEASARAMDTAGFIIKVEDNRLIKEYRDGRIEVIREIDRVSTSNKIILD